MGLGCSVSPRGWDHLAFADATLSSLYKGHRFPVEIISHCVWLYHRFPLSLCDVEQMRRAAVPLGVQRDITTLSTPPPPTHRSTAPTRDGHPIHCLERGRRAAHRRLTTGTKSHFPGPRRPATSTAKQPDNATAGHHTCTGYTTCVCKLILSILDSHRGFGYCQGFVGHGCDMATADYDGPCLIAIARISAMRRRRHEFSVLALRGVRLWVETARPCHLIHREALVPS
jgi:hypothetical protein